jgi:hypothetical protein
MNPKLQQIGKAANALLPAIMQNFEQRVDVNCQIKQCSNTSESSLSSI